MSTTPLRLVASSLLLFVGIACACRDRGKRADGAAVARPAPAAAAPVAPAPEPWPAGPLVAERVKYQVALYFAPAPSVDPVEAIGRCASAQPGLRRVEPGSEPPSEPAFAVRRPPISAYVVPAAEALRYFGEGLSAEQVQAVQKSADPLVVTFAAPGARSLDLLRASTALMACAAEATGGLVWDEPSRRLFALAAWKERLLGDAPPLLSKYITMHVYEKDGAVRVISLGMEKLGLPDLVIERATQAEGQRFMVLINLAAQELFAQGALARAGQLDVDVASIGGHAGAPATGKGVLELGRGVRDDGDPDNRLVELRFGAADGREHERQIALLDGLFGPLDAHVLAADHDDRELQAASERARARLPELRRRFLAGELQARTVAVKAPFEAEGGTEWMWVEVREWKGDTITGILMNRPQAVRGLAQGARVTVEIAGVFDYTVHDGDDLVEGGETNAVLQRQAGGR